MNFGSNIQFTTSHKGEATGIKYQWIASAGYDSPETIYLNKNSFWFKIGDKRMIRILRHVFSHEPIHNIINHKILGKPVFEGYDRLRIKFYERISKDCPKTYKEWNAF